MSARFTCRSAEPNNGIMQIHLTLDEGQPNDVYINATAPVLARMCQQSLMAGDEVGVQLSLIRRAGSNGPKR